MQLWEMIFPCLDNAGRSYTHSHSELRAILLDSFGGYTVVSVDGGWRDGADIYDEECIAYRVLTDAKPSLDFAWGLFPDQVAFYLARIGEGEIITRKEAHAA
jgi:hypothetical protein